MQKIRAQADLLALRPWPGNVRELENFVNRYVVLADQALAISELQPNTNGNGGAPANGGNENGNNSNGSGNGQSKAGLGSKSLKDIVQALKDEIEVRAIIEALEETRWNRKEAARLLNISHCGLLYKIQSHHIDRAVEARTAIQTASSGPAPQ